MRCLWAESSDLMRKYHDTEWGKPLYDDFLLFQKLILDSFQAGLSWAIILNKRNDILAAFDGFDPTKVAFYDDKKISELLNNPKIIRNKLKIKASITNSQLFLKHFSKQHSFTEFLWSHVDFKPVDAKYTSIDQVPATSPISEIISQKLKTLGFKFVGSTVIYAFLQAVGIYNDHLVTCPIHDKYKEEERKKR